jgi:RimJ/RimL family protein N-acetyltransferase
MGWPEIRTVTTARLRLEPLTVTHAPEMVDVLADASLYEYTAGEAPTLERLERRYEAQSVGHSEDGSQGWFNWIVKLTAIDSPIGFVQATVEQYGPERMAYIAWVISPSHQGLGLASEAATGMTSWLRSAGVTRFAAYVHPEHSASMGVARNQGLHPTPDMDDGEIRWES